MAPQTVRKPQTLRKATTRRTARGTAARPKERSQRSAASGAARGEKKDRPDPFPQSLVPQLATLAKEAPAGDQWLHEVKFDGYRMLCRIENGKAKFFSRNQLDWTRHLRQLVKPAQQLPVDQALLDGEVVALNAEGIADFQILQNAMRGGQQRPLVYFVFDLLYLNGNDLRSAPLEERKEMLEILLADFGSDQLRYTDHIVGHGPTVFEQAAQLKLEGIISKRRRGVYVSGRSSDWLKVKALQREAFVIGGFTAPSGSRTGFGSLLVGYHDERGRLIYAGKVGTGFDERSLSDLTAQFQPLSQRSSPFANLRGSTGNARGATWLKPALVAQVAFSNWTNDGHLRHATFLGLRIDKRPHDVIRVPQAANA